MSIKQYAVMGNPIAHSLSPSIHRAFAQQTGCVLTYEKMCIPLNDFEQHVRGFFDQGGMGLNITLPFKQRAYAMCERVSERCLRARSANTLWKKDGVLWGDNTDGIGLVRDLHRYQGLSNTRILVLGAGGAAAGIVPALLAEHPSKLTIANRTLDRACALANLHTSSSVTMGACLLTDIEEVFDLVICTIPSYHEASERSNMMPIKYCSGEHGSKINPQAPWPWSQSLQAVLSHHPLVYDLNYVNGGQTPMVAWAASHGCLAVDGLGMLVEQAAEAFYCWHGIYPASWLVDELLSQDHRMNDPS